MRRSKVRHWPKAKVGTHTLVAWCGRAWDSTAADTWDPVISPELDLRVCESCQRSYQVAIIEAFPPDPPEGYS